VIVWACSFPISPETPSIDDLFGRSTVIPSTVGECKRFDIRCAGTSVAGPNRIATGRPSRTQRRPNFPRCPYNGKKLNSPNDLVVKSDGAVFFTDPPFNIPAGEKQELSFSGIYRISPSGALQLLDSTLALPNGICFSPDEKRLYVNNSGERVIYVWDVVNDSTLANKRPFASIQPAGNAMG